MPTPPLKGAAAPTVDENLGAQGLYDDAGDRPDQSDVVGQLTAGELGMWAPETRYDDVWMDRHLHADFVEFGRSGRRYDRSTILAGERRPFAAELSSLQIERLTADVALVTYESVLRRDGAPEERANRSSIWVRVGRQWRLRFHQGTPTG